MRWLLVTVALLGATAAFAGAIYARDLAPGAWRPPERQIAAHDAAMVLRGLTGGRCADHCAVTGLTQRPAGWWRAAITVRSWRRCVDIDITRFAVTSSHGIQGIRIGSCRAAG